MKPDEPEKARLAESAMAAYRALLQEAPTDTAAKWNYELALRLKKNQGAGGSRETPQSSPQQSPTAPREENQQMSRQQAEQLLAAASRDERDTQAKRQAGTRVQPPPGGKGW
jgi:hypothetical protein